MSFNDDLKLRQPNFEINGGYDQNAMPEVFKYYQAYKATGKYPYLDSIVDYICRIETVDDNLKKYLKTEVYLASDQSRREELQQHRAKMLAAGWLDLTSDAIKLEVKNGNRIEVNAEHDTILGNIKIENIYKPIVDVNGHCWLMKPRATRNGYPLSNFENAFYKVVK